MEKGPMEVHFAWALEGRAVQDTWLAPTLEASPALRNRLKRNMYGTTIRVFDPVAKVWRAQWLNPVSGVHCTLIGRRVGDDIVQMGFWQDRPQRWRFCNITENAFFWQAHSLDDDGETWRLITEFRMQRVI